MPSVFGDVFPVVVFRSRFRSSLCFLKLARRPIGLAACQLVPSIVFFCGIVLPMQMCWVLVRSSRRYLLAYVESSCVVGDCRALYSICRLVFQRRCLLSSCFVVVVVVSAVESEISVCFSVRKSCCLAVGVFFFFFHCLGIVLLSGPPFDAAQSSHEPCMRDSPKDVLAQTRLCVQRERET